MDQIVTFFQSLKYNPQFREAVSLALYMGVGGLAGLYIRLLYLRFGVTVANRDSFSSNFALLTISTVLVIFVVKSSLALSLGLVGALSIVRFRAAIKEPEELVFLFFSIAAGLALGAEYIELAVAGVLVFSIFVMLRHFRARSSQEHSFLLTINGQIAELFNGDSTTFAGAVRDVTGPYKLQALDVDDGEIRFRALVVQETDESAVRMIATLRQKLPNCRISSVSLSNVL